MATKRMPYSIAYAEAKANGHSNVYAAAFTEAIASGRCKADAHASTAPFASASGKNGGYGNGLRRSVCCGSI